MENITRRDLKLEVGKLPACSLLKETPVSRIAENWEVPWASGKEGKEEEGGGGGGEGNVPLRCKGRGDGGKAGGNLLKGFFYIRISHNECYRVVERQLWVT